MTITFIGAGNIASAIIKGITKDNYVKKENIVIYDVSEDVCKAYREKNFKVSESFNEALLSDIIFLTVKPQFYESVLSDMKDIKNKLIVTVAPGIAIKKVKSFIDSSNKVIRTMPNTPLMVGEGMTVVAGEEGISEKELKMIADLFEKSGKVIFLKEELIDAAIGVFSSAPAYVYMFIDALIKGGVKNGIDEDTALTLATQAVFGSAKMVAETKKTPDELKNMVCSPNGTTIRAVESLEKDGFKDIVIRAMDECYKRAKELGK